MPEAQMGDAARRAQELCNGVRDLDIEYQGRSLGPVTVSIGVTSLSGKLTSKMQLLQSADAALYHAKHTGRNRVAMNQDGEISVRRAESVATSDRA